MFVSSYALRQVMNQMIASSNSNWKFCEYIPRQSSPKWDLHDGLLILVLSAVHFSVLGIKKLQETQQFIYVHLCNEGRPLPILYRGDLRNMGASNITPRHGIRNTDGNKCGYYVLWFSKMLIAFGTDIVNLDSYFIRNYFEEFDEETMHELHLWVSNY